MTRSYALSRFARQLRRRIRPEQTTMRVASFHIGRCGSSVLGDLLDQQPSFQWDGELFFLREKPGRAKRPWLRSPQHPDAPFLFLESRIRKRRVRRYGFETKPFHVTGLGLELPEYVAQLEALSFDRFIVLRRRNLLRKFVSSRLIATRGHAHLQSHERARPASIEIEAGKLDRNASGGSLIDVFEGWERFYAELAPLLSGREVLHLEYERDIQDDPRVALRKCAAFLDFEVGPVDVRFTRINPFPLAELIENFEAVGDYLRGTPYEAFLEEGEADSA